MGHTWQFVRNSEQLVRATKMLKGAEHLHKLKYKKSHLNALKPSLQDGGHTVEQVSQCTSGVSTLVDIQFKT